MSAITVVATIRARPGKEKDVEAMLKGFLNPTHREPGCVKYALHRSLADPAVWVFIEKWTDPAALEAHLSAPHITSAFAKRDELLASLSIETLAPVPGGLPEKEFI